MKYMSFLTTLFVALMGFCACGGDDDDQHQVITPENTVIADLTLPPLGGTKSVTTQVEKEWGAFATNGEDWIKVSPASGAKGSVNLTIEVAPNKTIAIREGQVTIKAGSVRQYINIKQEAPLQLSVNTIYSKSIGESLTVTVTTAGDWKASTNESWLTAQKTDAQTLTITTAANEALAERTGQVKVTCGSEEALLTVRQGSAEDRNIEVPLAGYHLVWHDEFSEGTSLNADWRHEVKGSGWVNNELQNYVNQTTPGGQRVTEIVDGKLQIHCLSEGGKVYSGRVYAKQTTGWKYGYVQAKIKLPSGKGTWPAFWMMPVNFKSWPHDGEIDIMEEVGYHKDYVSSSLHADGHVHSNGTQVTKEVYCKGAEGEFHTYGMEWTPDYFQFYVDGTKTLYYKNPGTGVRDWPYDAPFYVILNLAWGGDWGGSQGVNPSALPVTMEVEWVRVFQKD